jgi:hypothetical protein
MSKWDETDPYTDYELGSSRPHGPLPKPEPEPNWRSMYFEKVEESKERLKEILRLRVQLKELQETGKITSKWSS